jgi:hypothetical protein
LVAGYLMDSIGIEWGIVFGGGAALTGVDTFVAIVASREGIGALRR